LEGKPILYSNFGQTSDESEEFTFLLSKAQNAIYVVDAKSHEVLFANEQALRTWKEPDFTGKSCFLAMNGLEEPCPWCPLGKLVNGSFNQSGYFSPISGLYYDLTCQALNWHGHEAVAFYCHDTTEEKKGRAQVEFDKQSLELIVNNLPVGVAAIEIRDGQVIANAVNPRLSELMGMNAEDFVSPAPILDEPGQSG
jgi:hypothetical protein